MSEIGKIDISASCSVEEKYAKLVRQRTDAVLRWQQKNKDKVAGYQKAYIEKNKNKFVKFATAYNKSNTDKYKEYQSNYRQTRLLRKLPFFQDESFRCDRMQSDGDQGESD
jgi:hypothetical protein